MADITMCQDETCSKRKSCYRFTATVTPERQSYFADRPSYPNGCDEFTHNGESEKQPSKLKGRKLEPKYKDPVSGKTWAGRGRLPSFVKEAIASGKTLEDFKI